MNTQEIASVLKTLPQGFYGGNLYDEKEIAAASRVIFNKSPFRFYGSNCTFETEQFERECRDYFGVRYVHTTNSGCGALLAGLHALEVGPGDEVIIPGFFWVAGSNTVVLRGAIPVLCEVDDTFNMDPTDLAGKITPKTKAVIAVHMTGAPADMESIVSICAPRGIRVLEDFSQCVGGSLHGKILGGIADIGIASLQLNKIITSGEGGLIFTNNEAYYRKVTARTDLGYPRIGGISSKTDDDSYTTFGEGRRFGEISAAIMREQLRKLPDLLSTLRANKRVFKERIAKTGKCTFRRILDKNGETASVLILTFESVEQRTTFFTGAQNLFPGNLLRITPMVDTGLHVYYNCTNLTKKIPALPGGFPWNLPENANTYSYDKGVLPRTDDLIDRSVQIVLPPDLSDVHREAYLAAFDAVFAAME